MNASGGVIRKAMLAGFIATVVLSVLMIIKAFTQVLPGLEVIGLIHGLTRGPLLTGWIGHFVMGSVIWGIAFALLYRRLPGNNGLFKGLAFGLLAWSAMMLIFMPVAGAGFFAVAIGWPAAAATLVLHLIYGAVLGTGYALIKR